MLKEEEVAAPADEPRERQQSLVVIPRNDFVGFFLAGLFNNSSYVIMIAGAKHISPSMVGLVYVCNEVPSLLVKITGPYWFHLISYRLRMVIASTLMAGSFILVAFGEITGMVWLQLLGVAVGSIQSGFGEASYLALTAFYDSRATLTAWSSGTGFAGIFGYAWVVTFTIGFKASFQFTLFVALILPVLFWLNYLFIMNKPVIKREDEQMVNGTTGDTPLLDDFSHHLNSPVANGDNGVVDSTKSTASSSINSFATSSGISGSGSSLVVTNPMGVVVAAGSGSGTGVRTAETTSTPTPPPSSISPDAEARVPVSDSTSRLQPSAKGGDTTTTNTTTTTNARIASLSQDYTAKPPLGVDLSSASVEMTFRERIQNTLALWPYMIPLVVVYFSEYALQSGVWAAIGFPVTSASARDEFYEYSNFVYQGGVLISRSSGLIYKADMKALWVMPFLQMCMLLFFLLVAYTRFWYDWGLLIPCFMVGLLGGAVYVGGFSLLAESVPPSLKEFSLCAASVANGIGVACANVAGIYIQEALYDYYNISDDE